MQKTKINTRNRQRKQDTNAPFNWKLNKRILISFFIFFIAHILVSAQENLEIENIFQKYGMREGSVLVELSTDVLSEGDTKISFYKSLIISENPELETIITKAVHTDVSGSAKMMESFRDGKIETGYYCLTQGKTSQYILYKNKSRKITLVYLEGKFPPRDLEKELDKLKDLFIYINDKRIKLQ